MGDVCSRKAQMRFSRGEVVFESGTKPEDFIYLKSGLLKYYTTLPNGKTQILSLAKPFDTIGILTLFNEEKASYTVSALEDSTVCYIPLSQITDFISKNGSFALDFVHKMSSAANHLIFKQLQIKNKNIYGRLADILLELSDEIYKNKVFDLPVSRRDLADMIGMTTENVIRTLSEFRRDELIEISGKRITILDKKGLQKISQNS